MKKILIFNLVYYPRFVGGAEVAVKEITDRIPPGEISFDMVTLRNGMRAIEKVGNSTIYRIIPKIVPMRFAKYLFPFIAYFKADALHRKNEYDAIWSIMANYAGFGALFFKWKHPNVPFILTLQEGDSLEHIRSRVGLVYPLFKKIFTKADKIQAISTFLAEWARYMGATAHVYVVPNGVNVSNFQFPISSFQKEELRKKLGIKEDEKVVITTSRLVEKNGVGDLIESFVCLPQNVQLLICGRGPLERSLKLKVKSLTLENRIKFLGFISHQELPQYLHVADVFCRPSRSEGLGISFLEAMAAGLPVVATPVGGIPDFLTSPSVLPNKGGVAVFGDGGCQEGDGRGSSENDNITGLFCRVGDPHDIATKIQLLLSNDPLRQRIIENASNMVREKYDWSGIARKMKMMWFFEN